MFAVIRSDSPGLGSNANNVLIIHDNDVVVVDTNLTPSYTREVLEELKKLTDKPVKYVINTHWHEDHIAGNQVYRDAYPGVEFIAHTALPGYMSQHGFRNRSETLKGLPGFISYLRDLLKKRTASNGRDLSSEEMNGLANDVSLAERYLNEGPTTEIILPTKTVSDKLILTQGRRRIEILHLGRGHTSGDIVVHLPKEKVVVSGDLVVHPVPYVGGDQSYVGDWSKTLDKILYLKPSVIIPGHGDILRNDSYLRLVSRLFVSVRRQALAAIIRGENSEQAQKSLKIEEFEKQIVGESFYRRTIFRNYVAGPAVVAVYREAKAK